MKHLINSRTQTTHLGDKNGGQTDHFEKISPKIGINRKQNCIYVIIFISKISNSIYFVKIFSSVADTLKSQCDDSDAIDIPIKRRVNFLCAQLKLCCVISDNGRRYTAELMQTAIELMLRSRSCYKALLNILALPSIQTVKSYFGKLGSPESLGECK